MAARKRLVRQVRKTRHFKTRRVLHACLGHYRIELGEKLLGLRRSSRYRRFLARRQAGAALKKTDHKYGNRGDEQMSPHGSFSPLPRVRKSRPDHPLFDSCGSFPHPSILHAAILGSVWS